MARGPGPRTARPGARARGWVRCAAALALGTACAAVAASPDGGAAGPAVDAPSPLQSGRLRAMWLQLDNDSVGSWAHHDRWYTSGLVVGWVGEGGGGLRGRVADGWCAWTGCGAAARRWRTGTLEHRLWTPSDTARVPSDPFDRPYAAWLALGVGVLLVEPATHQRLDLRVGVTGPAAQGEAVQNGVHRLIGVDAARGWSRQVRPRLGLQLGWTRLDRGRTPVPGLDWVGRLGVDAGTVAARAAVGAALRWGRPPAGPDWPGEPAVPWVDGHGEGRWHLFAGLEGRWVLRDRLIDGPVDGEPVRVTPRRGVGDLFVGGSVRIVPGWRVDLSLTWRSVAFDTPDDTGVPMRAHRFGTLMLRWTPRRASRRARDGRRVARGSGVSPSGPAARPRPPRARRRAAG